MDVETVLAQAFTDRGIEVERGTALAGVHDDADGVRAVLRSDDNRTKALFGFVAGCDGAASTMRSKAGIGWPGRPYPVEVVLADADLPGTLPLGPLVRLHHITSSPGRGLLAVRPDGYVGLPCRIAEPGQLTAWLDLIGAPRSTVDAGTG